MWSPWARAARAWPWPAESGILGSRCRDPALKWPSPRRVTALGCYGHGRAPCRICTLKNCADHRHVRNQINQFCASFGLPRSASGRRLLHLDEHADPSACPGRRASRRWRAWPGLATSLRGPRRGTPASWPARWSHTRGSASAALPARGSRYAPAWRPSGQACRRSPARSTRYGCGSPHQPTAVTGASDPPSISRIAGGRRTPGLVAARQQRLQHLLLPTAHRPGQHGRSRVRQARGLRSDGLAGR